MPDVPKKYNIDESRKLAAKSNYRLRYPSGNGQVFSFLFFNIQTASKLANEDNNHVFIFS
jgi:hypothetical protein